MITEHPPVPCKNYQDDGCSVWCLPQNTLIISNPEPIAIQNAKVVLGVSGYNKVIRYYERYIEEEIFEIKCRGFPIRITKKHPIKVATLPNCRYYPNKICKPNCKTKHWGKKCKIQPEIIISWKTPKELTKNDYLLIPKIKPTKIMIQYKIKRTRFSQKRVSNYIKIDKNFGWIIGLYVAEGNCLPKGSINYSLGLHEVELARELKAKLKRVFSLPVYEHIDKEGNVRTIFICCSDLYELFKECGRGASNKIIPYYIWQSSIDVRNAFLDGYMSGDGCPRKTGNTITTKSEKLMLQLFIFLSSLGINFSCSKLKYEEDPLYSKKLKLKKRYKKDYGYRFQMTISFSKRSHCFKDDNFLYVPFKKKKIFYKGIVCNLMTEDNTYALPFIVHNCCKGDLDCCVLCCKRRTCDDTCPRAKKILNTNDFANKHYSWE